MTPTTEALYRRAEEATEGSRELDALIATDLDGWTKTPLDWTDQFGRKRNQPIGYTASVDAALALVQRLLPGWTIGHMSQGDNKLWTTLPLAIILAVLRALRSFQTGDAE